jgi:hypothetical protein
MKQKCDKNNTPSLVDKAHDGLVLAPGEQILFEGMMHVQINGKSYTTDGVVTVGPPPRPKKIAP